ncbi:hypothetical protein IA57_09755 [Mangrovimonas yunxiaonensis]|uniref:UDP-3-O-(3-hydroxymyristoyl) glucosamine N-acyltransferase n=1 Tax=Mangrovimonas yunxiaonensis TaxID=1197477 RepID=A0A084TJ50_9FLAO|nr:hypothetical protein [Mangrovimonas yunxiaonensis]KFB00736.1 hypothetical protein IA57_09755 [Mangrovimonas yunxiaonensis]GGH46047.1 hypothetical protein GCM10011364_19950 [Mangrovimonas yunxiaonensis]
MKLDFKEIKEFLNKHAISFKCNDSIVGKYELASLFNPVDFGFYFFTGTDAKILQVNHSLFLVSNDFKVTMDCSNQYVYLLEHDPQHVYYLIMLEFFGTKSTGVIAATSRVDPEVKLGNNVQIDDFCVIEKDVIIGDNVIIGSHCKIHKNSVIRKNTILETMSVIGARGVAWVWDKNQEEKILQPQLGGVEIKENCFLGANTVIVRGSINEKTTIGASSYLAPGCRIGHGSILGNYVHLANNVITGGNTVIGDYSFVGSGVVFRPKIKIHAKTIVGVGAVIVKNTSEENKLLKGVPAQEYDIQNQMSGMPKPKQ